MKHGPRAAGARAPARAVAAKRVVDGAGRALSEVIGAFAEPGARRSAQRRDRPRTAASCWAAASLDDFKRIKDALGGTVNDVFLAVVAGALRGWLPTAASTPRGWSCAPWSRSPSAPTTSTAQLGNRIAAMRAPLPVCVEDPVERLRLVTEDDGAT